MSFFIDFTAASALPLLCEYRGDDVQCDTPNSLRKFASLADVNCGPPSDQRMFDTVVWQNWSLRASMSFAVVVSLHISMVSGQSVLQSTMMRNCLPPL